MRRRVHTPEPEEIINRLRDAGHLLGDGWTLLGYRRPWDRRADLPPVAQPVRPNE